MSRAQMMLPPSRPVGIDHEKLVESNCYEVVKQNRYSSDGEHIYLGKCLIRERDASNRWGLYTFNDGGDQRNIAVGSSSSFDNSSEKTSMDVPLFKKGTPGVITYKDRNYEYLPGSRTNDMLISFIEMPCPPSSPLGEQAAMAPPPPAEVSPSGGAGMAGPVSAAPAVLNGSAASAAPAAAPAKNEFNRVSAAARQRAQKERNLSRKNTFNNGVPTRRKMTNSKFYTNSARNTWALSPNGIYTSLKNGSVRNKISNPRPASRHRRSTRRRSRKGDRSRR